MAAAKKAPAKQAPPAKKVAPAKKATLAKKATPMTKPSATKSSAPRSPTRKAATTTTTTTTTKAVPKKAADKSTGKTARVAAKAANNSSSNNNNKARGAASRTGPPAKKAPPTKRASATTGAASAAPGGKAAATKKSKAATGSSAVTDKQVTGWAAKELRAVGKTLEAELAQLRSEYEETMVTLNDLQQTVSDSSGDDQADAGSKTFEREHEMSLANNRLDLITQIEHALVRIADGTYGRCESCGQVIAKARLQAFPGATLCLSCKQREERR
ncbi:MAG: TraR/DksA C4-type zinc finger protein [Geodermatophilaceae bacterium]|nr:TraR/DksA C4-type zinc finger protein [Geodermatophilaceae bacterium]